MVLVYYIGDIYRYSRCITDMFCLLPIQTEERLILTAGVANIRVFFFNYLIKYHILNMLKIKCDINQQDLKRVDLHFVKSE